MSYALRPRNGFYLSSFSRLVEIRSFSDTTKHPMANSARPPLTTASLPTIVETKRMVGTLPSNRYRRAQVLLCFLLVLLFLYNPFVPTPSSGELSIRHIPSYRATIAASELQGFRPTVGIELSALSAILFLATFLLASIPSLQFINLRSDTPRSSYQVSSASLWFRPPPSI
jgi:hypothetical protein